MFNQRLIARAESRLSYLLWPSLHQMYSESNVISCLITDQSEHLELPLASRQHHCQIIINNHDRKSRLLSEYIRSDSTLCMLCSDIIMIMGS